MKIMYFGAPWCGMCKAIKPEVQATCKQLNIDLQEINLEESEGEELAARYGVRNLPTILLIENDEVTTRAVSIMGWRALREALVK